MTGMGRFLKYVDLHRTLIQLCNIFAFCSDPSLSKAFILNAYTCAVSEGTFFGAIGGSYLDAN